MVSTVLAVQEEFRQRSLLWIRKQKRAHTGSRIFCRTVSTSSFLSKPIRKNPESISVRSIHGKSHYCCLPTTRQYFHPAIFYFNGQTPCWRRRSTQRN